MVLHLFTIFTYMYADISLVSSLRPETLRTAVVSDLAGNLEALKKGRHGLEVGFAYYPKFVHIIQKNVYHRYLGFVGKHR